MCLLSCIIGKKSKLDNAVESRPEINFNFDWKNQNANQKRKYVREVVGILV